MWRREDVTIFPSIDGINPTISASPWYANTVPYYRLAQMAGSQAPFSAQIPINQIRFIPFKMGRSVGVDALAITQSAAGGAGSVARCGIYNANQQTMAPTTLVVESGSIAMDGANGLKAVTGLSARLYAGRLYYAVYVCGVAAPSIHAEDDGRGLHSADVFGFDPTAIGALATAPTFGAAVLAFGALPANAPTMTSTSFNGAPVVYARFE